MRARSLALAMLAVALPACGSIPGLTIEPGTATPATATAPAPTPTNTEVTMCTLVPLADVQAKAPFQTALAESAEGAVPGMCEYSSGPDAEEPVSVLLVVTEFTSADDARTSLANARQANVDIGVPVGDIAGLGETAFSAGVDEVGVHAVIGNRLIDANLGGEWPDTTDDAKVAAGTELVRTIISRLP